MSDSLLVGNNSTNEIGLQFAISTSIEVLTLIAVVAGVVIGYLGLRTWQRQLKGTADFDLAKRLLHQTILLRDNMIVLRAPEVIWPIEVDVAQVPTIGFTQEEIQDFIYTKKLQKKKIEADEARTKLSLTTKEAEALWGRDFYHHFEKLFYFYHTMTNAIQLYTLINSINTPSDVRKSEVKRFERVFGNDFIFRDNTIEIDKFEETLFEKTQNIERFLYKYLQR